MRLSPDRLIALLDCVRLGLGAADSRGVVTYVNRSLAKWLEASATDIEDRPVTDWLDPVNQRVFREQFESRSEGNAAPYVLTLCGRKGSNVTTTQFPAPLLSTEGALQGSLSVMVPSGALDGAVLSSHAAHVAKMAQVLSNMQRLSEEMSHHAPQRTRACGVGCSALNGLTPRQQEVALRLQSGVRVPAIAKHLNVSENTVRAHTRAIYQALGVQSRAELVVRLADGCSCDARRRP